MSNRLIVLGLLAGLIVPAAVVRAQTAVPASAGTMPEKKYTHSKAFKLPFQIDAKDRARYSAVQLYVKSSPSDPWILAESVPPFQNSFTYRPAQDGEYWFLVVTVDQAGVMTPSDLTKEAPGVVVVVDSQPPELEVRPLRVASGETLLQCEMRDANPDYSTIRLEYQAADKSWKSLEALPELGVFRAPDPSVLTGVVKATASDRAGNQAVREVNFGAAATTAQAPAPASAPVIVTNSSPSIVTQPTPGVTQVAMTTPAEQMLPPPHVAEKVAAPVLPEVEHHQAAPSRQIINGTHATLEYQVDEQGPSGVGRVEVWITRDDGQNWQRLCEDPDHRSPVEMDLPGEGLFGIKLVVSNGRGFGGTPPVKGDTPDWWVEVDTTKPQGQLTSVEPGSGADNGCLVISWTASDKNLGPEPVDLYYAGHHDGPWQPVAKGVKNNGSYRWSVPQDVGPQLFVRLEVTDRAGNSCRWDLQQPVVLDLSRPKVHVLGIAASTPRLPTPTGN